MSPKDFLLKFFLTVAAVLAAVYAFTYFEVKNGSQVPPDLAVTLPSGNPADESAPVSSEVVTRPGIGTEFPAETDIESKADGGRYPQEKYSVAFSQTGNLKNIAADHSAIIITDDDGKELRAVITDITEVFRDGVRVELSDIKETDRITVTGRKRSADGEEFVADSVYAVRMEELPVPVDPSGADAG